MNVLYIGHYRDGTGWGNAAVNNILALDSAGIKVIPRAITYEQSDSNYPERIKELEENTNLDCDIVIQHTLPHNYSYNANYKNIGCLTNESSNFKSTGWQHYCNLMDEIWVSSNVTKNQVIKSGVKKPVKVVPYCLDINKYKGTQAGQKIKELENVFVFGFVGESIERKNIKALVQAFHIEFDPKEPVRLFVKTSKTDIQSSQKYMEHIKRGLKLRKTYKEEIIVTGMMPEKDYISVLSQVDCFVMPSRGEAFCIPSLEAMALGIPCIWTEGIGMDHAIGIPVKSHDVPCFGAMETLHNLDTAYETWKDINLLELCKAMRKMYEHKQGDKWLATKKTCKMKADEYSHQNVGKKMKEVLNDR
jgi:glycosyltransferase involved in cell wall biosynthesis